MKEITLNSAFESIRNYLAGKAIGITRDVSLLHEVVKCLFCKIHIINSTSKSISPEDLAVKYREALKEIKGQCPFVFDKKEEILLDPDSIFFIDSMLESVNLDDPHNDPLSELFQSFIGTDSRGNEGQFFTPKEAVSWLVNAINPKRGERIIDPSCGAGSFLSFSAKYLKEQGVSNDEISSSLFGIEKDEYLSKLANTHLALTTLRKSNIFCADSIEKIELNGGPIPIDLDEKFDIVLANPPFGSKIKIGTEKTKKRFELAHKWSKDAKSGRYVKQNKLIPSPSPQILFLELCLKLLKPGGRLGIVLPESLISNSSSSYVMQYFLDLASIDAVIGMPENLFKTSGKGGTHTKTCLIIAMKKPTKKNINKIFMAETKWCGHDSRGSLIPHNDLPIILSNYLNKNKKMESSNLGYFLNRSKIKNSILTPRYYDPSVMLEVSKLKSTHEMISIGDLVEKGVLEIKTGHEVGKLAYQTGDIPFIRTSDISNWELKTDPKHGVSEEIYQNFASKQDVQEGDILMVRDGTYLIGTCAFISKYDTKIVYQSHLYKIRVLDVSVISPYLLLASLSSKPVIKQIQSKRFTQDIIDTIGSRIHELILAIPKNKDTRLKVETIVHKSIEDRIESRELAKSAKKLITAL